jgi:hypothetical protein
VTVPFELFSDEHPYVTIARHCDGVATALADLGEEGGEPFAKCMGQQTRWVYDPI